MDLETTFFHLHFYVCIRAINKCVSAVRPGTSIHTQTPNVTYNRMIPYSQTGIIIAPANYHFQLES